ncbi:MAG: glycosyltransferase [Pseudomonadota bacterium]
MTLAIVAPSFHQPGEPYIRDHVRTIAPGDTVLVCRDPRGIAALGCPVHRLAAPPWHTRIASRLQSKLHGLRSSSPYYIVPGPLPPNERERLVGFLRSHGVSCMLAEFGTMGIEVMDACDEAGIPLFVFFHGADALVLPRQDKNGLFPALFQKAHTVLVTTEFMRKAIASIGCPAEKTVLVPIGVDPDRFSRRTGHEPARKVAMVCRLIPQKGPLNCVDSFARLHRAHPDATLDIIGDGPMRADIEKRTEELKLSDAITLHGPQPHERVVDLMASADLLIQHSMAVPGGNPEPFGISLVEAMACEVPVVATRSGGIPEVVADGETGLLVEEGDIDGMAAAMIDILSSPEVAARMGAAGRQRVIDRFSTGVITQRLRQTLRLGGDD